MELRHLRYFVAVAEAENVSRAALKLRVSQPALSRQIRDLEDMLGVSLLVRTAKSVRLTEAGRVFAGEARAILARASEAMQTVRSVARGESGDLHLGYAPSPTAELLPRALHAFQNAAPGVRVVLHDNSTEENLRGLREGNIHLALMVRPCDESLNGLVFEPLQTYPMRVAMAPGHPLARQSAVSVERLARERLVAYTRSEYGDYHAQLEAIFAPSGGVPGIAQECDSAAGLIAAVEARRGVAIVPEIIRCLAGGRLRLRPLRDRPAEIVVGFCHAAGQDAPATLRMAATLRKLRAEQEA